MGKQNKMNDKNKRVYFLVSEGTGMGGQWTYPTYREAENQLSAMAQGFPDNKHMSDESRKYWIIAYTKHHIDEVTVTTKRII